MFHSDPVILEFSSRFYLQTWHLESNDKYCLKDFYRLSGETDLAKLNFMNKVIDYVSVNSISIEVREFSVGIVAIIEENTRSEIVKKSRNMINRTAAVGWDLDSCDSFLWQIVSNLWPKHPVATLMMLLQH